MEEEKEEQDQDALEDLENLDFQPVKLSIGFTFGADAIASNDMHKSHMKIVEPVKEIIDMES